MSRKKRSSSSTGQKTADYRYPDEKRPNIPPAQIAGEGEVPKVGKVRYAYSPHLPPTLQFDPTGADDDLTRLVDKAARQPLTAYEAAHLREALRVREPQLEWAGKREEREKGFLEVDPVALHIHERVSARAIVRAATREDVQRDLFADPQQPYQEAVQFYKHDVEWANRLILGDSLQVMSSLARRENLAGKVQMIYMDPPYGIKFASNFQPEIGKRNVKDKEQDLTREPEMVKAYRDTWMLGVHSYLAYLRDRLVVARELLTISGSIFVQISDENLHRVRAILDEVFRPENALGIIAFRKTTGQSGDYLPSTKDYLLWYCRDKSSVRFHQLFVEREGFDWVNYDFVMSPEGGTRRITPDEKQGREPIPDGCKVYRRSPLTSTTQSPSTAGPFWFSGRHYSPGKRGWSTNTAGLHRLLDAQRLEAYGETLSYRRYTSDFPFFPLSDTWLDTATGGYAEPRVYVVQTNPKVIERCLLMTTDPGDLVLDPTCGSGTTAYVAEHWGRRWITTDTSRVALSLARQRIMTSTFPHYKVKGDDGVHGAANPADGFIYKTVARITLKSIAQNVALDPLFEKHQPILDSKLSVLNTELYKVAPELRKHLQAKLVQKQKAEGKRAITDADHRRWELPEKDWREWEVPFDTDPDWPEPLQRALTEYRAAWRAKMDEVNAAVAANADQQELVDQPEVVRGVVRISGPFTVEGVHPEELNLDEEGLFDGAPNTYGEDGDVPMVEESKNLKAYLARMVQYIRQDGLTFLDNKRRGFARVEPLYETGTGAVLHAEAQWQDVEDPSAPCAVAIGFGPQYGPVTALQVEELIRASRRYDELIVAGFSFDAEATAIIQEQSNPRLLIHQAYIRPDVNPAMDGLLKETPDSQLFTVFGTPEIDLGQNDDGEWVVRLEGVDIYDPVANVIRSTGAKKVAAWFLDADFDGRCFCITQAFFPDQDAWAKIARSLGSAADEEAFKAFRGTESLPFEAGRYRRIAVKVIDPRGNEVMTVRPLES